MQGFVAMSGVFITLLICTSTALVILLTGAHKQPGLESTAITQEPRYGLWQGRYHLPTGEYLLLCLYDDHRELYLTVR